MTESYAEDIAALRATCSSNDKPNVWTVQYPKCLVHVQELSTALSRYRSNDAYTAVFSLNSWFRNRSAQTCTLALNAALMSISEFGTETINTYEELEDFYLEIRGICPIDPREDRVLPVMGHVSFELDGLWHPAIIGCGMVQEYPRLCFADSIVDACKRKAEFSALVQYVRKICETLEGGGWQLEGTERIRFELPPIEHWLRTQRWFNARHWETLPSHVVGVLSDNISPIEMCHFAYTDGRLLPLFNPSLLLDFLADCCHSMRTEDLEGLIDMRLTIEALSLYEASESSGSGCIAYPCFKIDGEFESDCPCTFLLFDNAGLITLFYNANQSDKNLTHLKTLLRKPDVKIEIVEGIVPPAGRRRAVSMDPKWIKQVILVAYNENVMPALTDKFVRTSETADVTCGSLDVMSILHISSDVKEIGRFFSLAAGNVYNMFQMASGLAPHFLHWKSRHQTIVDGVEPAGNGILLVCDFNDTDDWYCDFFGKTIHSYPFVSNTYCFGTPFAFDYQENDRGFTSIVRKQDGKRLGLAKRLSDAEYLYAHLYVFDGIIASNGLDNFEDDISAGTICNDAFMLMIDSLGDAFSRFAAGLGGIFSIGYVPESQIPALELAPIDEELGIYGGLDADVPSSVYYAIEKKKFVPTLMETNKRDVECRLVSAVIGLFSPEPPDTCTNLAHAIMDLGTTGKMVDMLGIELPYLWNTPRNYLAETDVTRAQAIKSVATAAAKAKVTPGEYMGSAANDVLRTFQGELTLELITTMSRYKRKDLLAGLCELCAQAGHDHYVHTKRYGAFSKVDAQQAKLVDEATFDIREKSRRRLRVARFCMEEYLYSNYSGSKAPDTEDLAYIVSLGDQLLSLCDEADILHFDPKGFGIDVDSDYVVSAIENESKVATSQSLRVRQLSDPGHPGGDGTHDSEYIKKAKVAFEHDTGIRFDCFIETLDILALSLGAAFSKAFVLPNVLAASKSRLVRFVTESTEGRCTEAEIDMCLGFLTIDPTALCTINGKELGYLPFGKIKDRPNRIELKPIIEDDGELMLSPVSLGLLRVRWIRGIAERFLPVKADFNALCGVISQWKKHYEKQLEKDAQAVFLECGFQPRMVYRGIELRKKGSHPQHLGDYDVLAYDTHDETIWAIECKEFEKVESAYDYMQLQQRWFASKGKLSKFERRIAYLQEHCSKVADDLAFPHTGTPSVKAYLVCNKLFQNLLGESPFEVITLTELKELLQNAK